MLFSKFYIWEFGLTTWQHPLVDRSSFVIRLTFLLGSVSILSREILSQTCETKIIGCLSRRPLVFFTFFPTLRNKGIVFFICLCGFRFLKIKVDCSVTSVFLCAFLLLLFVEWSLSHHWSSDENSSQQTEFWRVRPACCTICTVYLLLNIRIIYSHLWIHILDGDIVSQLLEYCGWIFYPWFSTDIFPGNENKLECVYSGSLKWDVSQMAHWYLSCISLFSKTPSLVK